ncbi:MAG: glutaredoxin 3 [Alphaproteobacteria bacterium]|nr:glutaredoxin 3 [Alphaproteobacteria bacterium]
MSAPVTIYTRAFCPYCTRALGLLKTKGAAVTEIDATFSPGAKAEMIQRANGARTFPQIFIGDHHVGGCDELHALDRAGRLDPLLAGA